MKRRSFLSLSSAALALSSLPHGGFAQNKLGLKGYLRTNWSRDPLSFGSYSYMARGARRAHVRALARPIGGTLFFAGEATHPRYNSTVHAAYESGLIAAQAMVQSKAHRIAIIGAGISGLAAAQILGAQGRNVTVYDARNRIGGRIHTVTTLGPPLDLGASWIHGTTDNPVAALALGAGAWTVETDESLVLRDAQGTQIAQADAPAWLDEVMSIQNAFGASRAQVNRLAILQDDGYDGPHVIFPTGYSQILSRLRGRYGVQLSSLVQAIDHSATGVSLRVTGEDATYDAALVTVPLGVLKQGSLTFTPALPQDTRDAIARLGMGTLDKLYLQFGHVFWDQQPTWLATPDTGLPQGQFNLWLNLAKFTNAPILMAFNGGPPALQLADLPDTTLLDRALSVLDRFA